MSAGGAPPPAQPNVRPRFWAYSPPGRIGSGSWATTGTGDEDRRRRPPAPVRAEPPRTGIDADHGCTSSGSMAGAAGSRQTDGGRVGRPPDALEQHGATRPVDAGARRRPVADGLVARRRGDVGRDARPHVQRCQVPVALEHERSAADGRGPARPRRSARWRPSPGSTATRRTGTRGRRRRRSRATPRRRRPVRCRSSRPRVPVAGSTIRVRHATSPHDATASRPSERPPEVRREGPPVAGVRREAGQEPDGRSAAGRAPPDAEVRARRAGRPGARTSAPRSVSRIALRITAPPSAIVDAQPPAGSTARRRDREPSSSPTSTTPPTGPDANDSGGSASSRARPPTTPTVSRWPASVPAGIEHRVHPEPGDAGGGGRAATAARQAGGSHGGSAVSSTGGRPTPGRPKQRDRGQGQERTRESNHLHEGLLRRDMTGGRRARTPVSRRPLIRHLSRSVQRGGPGGTLPASTGVLGPLHIRRGVIAKPVRVRHSPATVTAPSGAEVRSPIRRRRSSLREKGQAHRAIHRLTPPSIPKRGVVRVLPSIHRIRSTRGRTLTGRRAVVAPHHSPPCCCSCWPPSSPPARRRRPSPSPTAVAPRRPSPRRRRRRRHRRADRRPRRPPAPTFPVTLTDDEGTSVTIAAEPTKIVSLTPAATETLFALGARRPGRRQGRGLHARIRPRPPTSPTSPSSGPSTSRRSWPSGTDLVIAGGSNFNPPESIAKLRQLGRPGPRRVRARRPDRARRHDPDRAGDRQAPTRPPRSRTSIQRGVRRGEGRDVGPAPSRASTTSSTRRTGSSGRRRTTSAPR